MNLIGQALLVCVHSKYTVLQKLPEAESIVSAISVRSFLMLLFVGFMTIDAGICGNVSATIFAI